LCKNFYCIFADVKTIKSCLFYTDGALKWYGSLTLKQAEEKPWR